MPNKMNYCALIPNGREDICPTLISVIFQTIPPKSIFIVDNKENSTPPPSWIYNICKLRSINLIYQASTSKSIARVRFELSQWADDEYCLWVDDDVILETNYVEHLAIHFNSEIGVIQGTRIEVNGRPQSDVDINKMNSSNSEYQELEYGDTFGLLMKSICLSYVDWSKILSILDSKGVTGEDVVIGEMIRKYGFKIIGIPGVFGYHLSGNNFSYWNTFLASDRIRELHFNDKR